MVLNTIFVPTALKYTSPALKPIPWISDSMPAAYFTSPFGCARGTQNSIWVNRAFCYPPIPGLPRFLPSQLIIWFLRAETYELSLTLLFLSLPNLHSISSCKNISRIWFQFLHCHQPGVGPLISLMEYCNSYLLLPYCSVSSSHCCHQSKLLPFYQPGHMTALLKTFISCLSARE